METMIKDKQYIKDIEPLGSPCSSSGSVCEEIQTQDINYYINRIQDAIQEYSEEHENESIYKLTKTRWNAVLIYIYNKVFKPIHKNTQGKRNSLVPYENIDLLLQLADYYMYLCNEYNKDISINGYCNMIGISNQTITNWKDKTDRYKEYIDIDNNNYCVSAEYLKTYKIKYPNNRLVQVPNSARIELYKRLSSARQESLKTITLDGSIPALALGKIEFGWIEGGLQQKQAELLDNYTAPAELLDSYTRREFPENKI